MYKNVLTRREKIERERERVRELDSIILERLSDGEFSNGRDERILYSHSLRCIRDKKEKTIKETSMNDHF